MYLPGMLHVNTTGLRTHTMLLTFFIARYELNMYTSHILERCSTTYTARQLRNMHVSQLIHTKLIRC